MNEVSCMGQLQKVLYLYSRKFWMLTMEGSKNEQWLFRLLQLKCRYFANLLIFSQCLSMDSFSVMPNNLCVNIIHITTKIY